MNIYDYEAAFGAADKTTDAMRNARAQWVQLYYGQAEDGEDPCQRLAYTSVSKLTKAVFGEYRAAARNPAAMAVMKELEQVNRESFASALVEGECYLKPVPAGDGFRFVTVNRSNMLIFGVDSQGNPTDVGMVAYALGEDGYYTLLERRTVDQEGCLTIENRLFRSGSSDKLGQQVPLSAHPEFSDLPERYTYQSPTGLGLVRMKNPMLGCVDGSGDGVSVYAAAVGLIHAIDENEYQLSGEFSRGQSRVFVSADLLDGGKLQDSMFVGLDDDPQNVGITLFSPQLREQSFLRRKQEYLRNVESIIGIKRGLLCDANLDQRTATEISASETEHALTVLDFQNMWQRAVEETLTLCAALARVYGVAGSIQPVRIDWGNGVLFDEEKRWADYKEMVSMGLIRPEVALGWRFGLPAETEADLAAIRKKFMPNERK